MVGGRAVDLFRIDTRGSDCGHLADLSQRRRSHPLTHNGSFEPQESPDSRYLFYLDRPPAGLATGGTARLMRLPLGGGQEELVLERVRPFLWSVTETGIVFVTREPDFDAIEVYRFSDRRVTRVGRLGFRLPGIYTHMTCPATALGMATKLVRSTLTSCDSTNFDETRPRRFVNPVHMSEPISHLNRRKAWA